MNNDERHDSADPRPGQGLNAARMTPAINAPKRPALRYHGGKWRAAPWVISCLPTDHDVYAEPFGGSAAVLLRKSRSSIEVYNDMDGEVVGFFRTLRERPDELIRALHWTPFAHAEQKLSFELTDDSLEAARRFFVRSYLTIAGPTAQWNSGWRRQKMMSKGRSGNSNMKPAAVSFMELEHLYQVAERMRGVIIEEADALELIMRYDTPRTVFYVDPPYDPARRSRCRNAAYKHEIGAGRHREMANVLHACAGMVVLSGYDGDLYQELFGAWRRFDRDFRTNGNSRRMARESLWLNPPAQAALEKEQMPLFSSHDYNVVDK